MGRVGRKCSPFGALYVWRNWDKDNRRFRGTFSGVVNDVDYMIGLRSHPNWSLLFTLDNFIAPIGRAEYVEGQRVEGVGYSSGTMYSAVSASGIAFHLFPFEQDSASMYF